MAQKKILRAKGLVPEEWLVLKDFGQRMEVVSKAELARCRMRHTEGATMRPRTRILEKVIAAAVAALVAAAPLQTHAMEESEVAALAEEAGGAYGICPELLEAIAWQESSYRADASAGGCEGLMQISPRWHRERMERLGVEDLRDPAGNMLVAADYLAELFAEWEDPAMVLMVYNGDSDAGRLWETGEGLSDYAKDVLALSEELERKHGK